MKRNYGAQLSRGQWIAFIDDDCEAHARWLERAAARFDDPAIGAIEGRKEIPRIDRPTLTYKGLLSFTRPGGYQTCNMFYRREVFLSVKGFDVDFPFYLEDSDLAWSVLEAGWKIPHADDAVVMHPVPPAAPMRLLDGAKRSILMPRLYRKHPTLYRSSGTRVLRPVHWAYLLLYLTAIVLLVCGQWRLALVAAGAVLLLLATHLAKSFWRCRFTVNEFLLTMALFPIVPVVSLVQLIRGNIRERVWLWS